MTLNCSGFTNPRTGQRLPSTVLQVWGGDQNVSSTYHHNIGKIYPQHITTTLVETIETRRTAGWCWTRGWRGRSAGRSGSTCSASSATGGGRTRVSPRKVMRSEQQWSESQLEQKWCSLGRRRRAGICLMSRSHRNLTTNLKYLLLQDDKRHWLAKYPKIPTLLIITLTCVEYLPHTEGLTAWSPTNLSFQMMRHKNC